MLVPVRRARRGSPVVLEVALPQVDVHDVAVVPAVTPELARGEPHAVRRVEHLARPRAPRSRASCSRRRTRTITPRLPCTYRGARVCPSGCHSLTRTRVAGAEPGLGAVGLWEIRRRAAIGSRQREMPAGATVELLVRHETRLDHERRRAGQPVLVVRRRQVVDRIHALDAVTPRATRSVRNAISVARLARNARRSHASWNTGSSASISTGPNPCRPPRSWTPSIATASHAGKRARTGAESEWRVAGADGDALGMEPLTTAELEAGLDTVRAAPADFGRLELIVRRPAVGERETIEEGQLDTEVGLVGDTWRDAPELVDARPVRAPREAAHGDERPLRLARRAARRPSPARRRPALRRPRHQRVEPATGHPARDRVGRHRGHRAAAHGVCEVHPTLRRRRVPLRELAARARAAPARVERQGGRRPAPCASATRYARSTRGRRRGALRAPGRSLPPRRRGVSDRGRAPRAPRTRWKAARNAKRP